MMESTRIGIDGMTCQGCVASVTRVLKALPGVQQVDVSLAEGSASVHYDPAQTDVRAMRAVIEDAGYGVRA
ncbi:MAG TPA: heavy metal-associated domain-containing protein [Casimicrobiaceae bacterium]|jgi:copper chaperone CopZ|nr:heavy metal-associated domain-containing protein [Casimicrobiaceae bacterium]